MFTQKSIKIFHSVQEIRPFSLFQNLALGKASTDDKCHFVIVSLFQNLFMHNFIKIFKKFQEIGPVSLFFRIWTSATPRPIPNDIWQSLGLHLVNINMYAKFHHNSPLSSAIFTFSEFEPRQNLDLSQISFDNLSGYILSISMCMQHFITVFFTVLEIGPFSLFIYRSQDWLQSETLIYLKKKKWFSLLIFTYSEIDFPTSLAICLTGSSP